METSDSEYFESADEDFCSDDEAQTKKTQNIRGDTTVNVKEKIEDLSINDNLACKSIEKKDSTDKDDNTNKDIKDNEKCKDELNIELNKHVKIGACSLPKSNNQHQENDHEIPPAVSNSGLGSERTNNKPDNLEDKSQNVKNANEGQKRPEFGIPPTISTCWEPGVTNIAQPFQPHPAYQKLMENKKKCSPEDENKDVTNLNKHTKRPEFGIPPARTTCWMPGVTGRDNMNNQNYANSNITNSSKPQRPEFGIPRARTTCCIPGVTKVDNVNTEFEIHPAYLELMKKREQTSAVQSAVPNEPIQNATNTDNTNQLISSKPTEISTQNTEENMWDDEDWDDFDIPAEQDDKLVESKKEKKSPTQKKIKEDEENMWEDDDWEPVESNTQHQNAEKPKTTSQTTQEKSSWGDWSSWGLSSVISTATTLTTQVSQGISNALETGIGAPDPAELARINKLEKEKIQEAALVSNEELPSEKPMLGFGLGNLVQGVTKLVESTGTKVISGGLDTLETIGKKTMEVLQENDPGLKKKRAFLKLDDDKPILSHILREAKEKAEEENKELEKKHFARKANYETLFDDHQGLVHLEALEMLSKQCDIKLQSLLESTTSDALNDIQETLDQVKELCELPEEDDEETLSMDEIKEKLESAVSEINVKITYSRLLTTWEEVEDWLAKLNLKICNKNELHQQAIESLAQLTAIAVEQFHKAGELLLIKDHRSTADEADSLVQLTTTLTSLIGIVAARFSEKLNMAVIEGANKEEVNSLITNVFFEAANSSSYIQDAFQLLIPVLQVGAV